MSSKPVLIVICLLLCACTSRVEYKQKPVTELSPNAVNINTASVEELERLPGVGEKTAEAIVRFRLENGPFRRVEQVLEIRGMSESRFAQLRSLIKTE